MSATITLGLTDFVAIATKNAGPKATAVANVKKRGPYDPAADFYKPLREGIIDLHQRGDKKDELGKILKGLTDPKKIANYPDLIDGYRSWWGRKDLEWFSPPRGVFSHRNVDVTVNPELGLRIKGVPHVIKLHLTKTEKLSKPRLDVVTFLMEQELRALMPEARMCVLDVRNGKHVEGSSPPKPAMGAILRAELAWVAEIWDSL